MLKIQIPDNNVPERKYAIHTLLYEFLGLDHIIEVNDQTMHYTIGFDNARITIRDGFFSKYKIPLSYLSRNAIPSTIKYAINEFTPEKDIPVIYGDDKVLIGKESIELGIDIFASTFFMLTRWEEYVNKTKDKHGRFPGEESIANRNNFLQRPIINEYVEMLWRIFSSLGFKGKRKVRKFELVLTHDIDALTYASFRSVAGDLLRRKDFGKALTNSRYLFTNDPFDTYDFLMETSERIGVNSHFYFMASMGRKEFEMGGYLKRPKFKSIIRKIRRRGHTIGFHPGYYTYDDRNTWSKEKTMLEEAVKQEITQGRQHYLRMDLGATMSIWETNNMEIDSTLGYADKEGFRCGTGDTFRVFSFIDRKTLKLKERPLIVMDGTLRQYQKYSLDQANKTIEYYINLGKQYNSTITLLFHNSSFFGQWDGYEKLYKNLAGM